MVDVEYLEKERKLLWEAIEDLKKNQLKKLEESYNKLLQTIPQDVADLKSYKASIARLKTSFKDYKDLPKRNILHLLISGIITMRH